MRRFVILAIVFIFFGYFTANAQIMNSSNDKFISLNLPQNTITNGLQIDYFITGNFGGFGSFIGVKPKNRHYKIPTLHEGKSVETLKLVIFSPNYKVQIYDFPASIEHKKNIDLKFEPLGTVSFSGKVLLPNQFDAEKLQVKVTYSPNWKCEYFQLSDCLLEFLPIAFVKLEKDGKFKVNLPDFADDPIIASYKDKGNFVFRIEEKDGKPLFRLKPVDSSKGLDRIQTASNYPIEQVFISESER